MIRNFFRVAFRNLFRNKAFSIINIAGLTIGMASAILILLWVQNEISYDRFHKNGDRLYEVYSNDVINNSIRSLTATPEIMAPVLTNDVPEIESASRVAFQQYHILNVGENAITKSGNFFQSDFPEMISLQMIEGSRQGLKDPTSILLSESTAAALFGSTDPMNKSIRIGNFIAYNLLIFEILIAYNLLK